MLKIAVTAPIATARISTTVADNQPPRRTFLEADLKSVASVMGAPRRDQMARFGRAAFDPRAGIVSFGFYSGDDPLREQTRIDTNSFVS